MTDAQHASQAQDFIGSLHGRFNLHSLGNAVLEGYRHMVVAAATPEGKPLLSEAFGQWQVAASDAGAARSRFVTIPGNRDDKVHADRVHVGYLFKNPEEAEEFRVAAPGAVNQQIGTVTVALADQKLVFSPAALATAAPDDAGSQMSRNRDRPSYPPSPAAA